MKGFSHTFAKGDRVRASCAALCEEKTIDATVSATGNTLVVLQFDHEIGLRSNAGLCIGIALPLRYTGSGFDDHLGNLWELDKMA